MHSTRSMCELPLLTPQVGLAAGVWPTLFLLFFFLGFFFLFCFSFNKGLLTIFCVTGTVLGPGDKQ